MTYSFFFAAERSGIPSSGFWSTLGILILVDSEERGKFTELSKVLTIRLSFFVFLVFKMLQVRWEINYHMQIITDFKMH